MLTWILLFIVLAALVVLGTWSWGRIFGRGEVLDAIPEPATVIEDNRQLVEEGRLPEVRFELVPRGYRPGQVDDLLDQLGRKLMAVVEERDQLRALLEERPVHQPDEEKSGPPPASIE